MMEPNDGNQEKEPCGASADGDTEQETEPGSPEGNSTDSRGGPLEKGGCVYFIETDEGKFVKIGFTASLRSRLRQLEGTLRPTPIRFLGYIPGSAETEAFFHRRFAADRERGEWFRDTPELRAFIAALGLLQIQEPARIRKPRPVVRIVRIDRKPIHGPAVEPVPRSAVSLVMAELGRAGGRARAESLTPEQRQVAGQHAIAARWSRKGMDMTVGEMASRGGTARRKALSPERRKEISQLAASQRWKAGKK